MKKIFSVIVLVLAMNFLAAAGAAAYLWKGGHLSRPVVAQIKDLMFPKPAPATQPAAAPDPTTRPTLRLDELLAKQRGRPAAEQVDFVQHVFDARLAQVDQRERELGDLQAQVELAKGQLAKDRAAVDAAKADLDARQAKAVAADGDKGFQDSLALYSTLPPKQVKTIFMSLDDAAVRQYLQAMQPRTATRILKEFKTPDEVARVQRVMEQIRLGASAPTGASAATQATAAAR